MSDFFNEFCDIAKISGKPKFEVVLAFVWFNQYKTKQHDISMKQINQYFVDAHLSAYNPTYLKRDLNKSSKITKGTQRDTYKLNRKTLDELNKIYLPQIETEVSLTERANIKVTPFLKSADIDDAKKMAELYIILHCLENSVRNFIDDVLTKKLGPNWWDTAKNAELEKKFKERKEKEAKSKWLSPRGKASALFYIDWGDLVKIIRKFENDFKPYIDEMKFVELRLEELEKVRNIIAHNGVLPSSDDFDRLILHFKDWCKQVNET
ncbi:Swt1 family HEPN domain-containing protein [Pinibacter soli]|uniref:Swt1 family HEPN domain-containing protein n=1 Tax=Pinibacter soli TaxID=3044211 RepID=A0ABT6RDX5_9BACT|nr:Swt1 family HEPN domain-containing protein [Pinibacter soli]MDI3320778.1 Swt1 family HEPN domain-containing protein [Pinibacter soli]